MGFLTYIQDRGKSRRPVCTGLDKKGPLMSFLFIFNIITILIFILKGALFGNHSCRVLHRTLHSEINHITE